MRYIQIDIKTSPAIAMRLALMRFPILNKYIRALVIGETPRGTIASTIFNNGQAIIVLDRRIFQESASKQMSIVIHEVGHVVDVILNNSTGYLDEEYAIRFNKAFWNRGNRTDQAVFKEICAKLEAK